MDLDTLLRDTASVPYPTPQALAVGRATLDAASAAAARRRGEAGRARSRRLTRRTRRLGLTALVAAAVSAVFVIGPTLALDGSRPTANAEAAQVLVRAGAAAGAQPGGWPTAPYWRSVSSYRQGSGAVHRREIWIGHRDIGVLKDAGADTGVIPLDVALFPAGSRGLSWDQLYALPTSPGPLERELRAGINGAGADDDSELFTIVGDLLRETPAPPSLRKELWEVAARVPGVQLIGAVTDSTGRAGVAVQRGGQRYVLDPDNGRLLEESQGDFSATYLEQGPADSAPAPTH